MKKVLTLTLFFISIIAFSQNPKRYNYPDDAERADTDVIWLKKRMHRLGKEQLSSDKIISDKELLLKHKSQLHSIIESKTSITSQKEKVPIPEVESQYANERADLNTLKSSIIEKSKSTANTKGDITFVTVSDSLALVALYNSTDGANWTDNSNWLTAPVFSWVGIEVDGSRVTSIDFWNGGSGNNLTGSIPSEIGNLDALTFLDLSFNNITSSMPVQIGLLTNLQYLFLEYNQISGNIPSELGNLTNLEYLSLSDNQLTGIMPSELGNIKNLVALFLSHNQLVGSIPTEISNLTNITSLWIADNMLTGSIPKEIGNLVNLETLYLDYNDLSGFIPVEIGNLIKLIGISLYNNQLTGTIPAEIGNLVSLHDLSLYNNQLTGSIPVEIGNLINLIILNLDNNQLIGSIPSGIGNLANLEELRFSNNQLSGSIPLELGSLSNLQKLFLHHNELSGSIPSELGNLLNLTRLSLTENKLIGSIPSEIGNLANLQMLELSYNQITGSIPSELGNLINLFGLNLDNNQLTGSLPAAFANLINLTYLYIHYNQLTGLVDLSPTNIQFLPLNNNYFTFGDLENTNLNFTALSGVNYSPQARLSAPSEVDNGNNTTTVTVTTDGTGSTYQWYKNSTLLSGETANAITVDNTEECYYYCEVSNSNYPDLQLETEYAVFNLNMSHGVLEEEYNALVALYNSTNGDNWTNNTNWLSNKYVDEWYGISTSTIMGYVIGINLSYNNLSSSIPSELGNLSNLSYLDLSSNQLSGSIPAEVGNLTSLIQLYLGYNQLTGAIPAELGSLVKLQTLWLTWNQLTGSIPSSIGNLVNLQELSLDNNQLTGSILSELGNLSNLSSLSLQANQLSGSIPAELGSLINLHYLFLQDNQLSGSIPSELGNLTNLIQLLLFNNQLTGLIPSEIGSITSLLDLELFNNQLNGSLPVELGDLTDLLWLNLSNNQLTGSISSEIGNLASLEDLNISDNFFDNLPDLTSTNIQNLYLVNNYFTFGDLENTNLNFSALDDANYSPQKKLPEPDQTDNGNNTTTVTVTTDGTGNTYQWYKNSTLLSGETANAITVDNTEECYYYCEVSNLNYPDLQLNTEYAVFNMNLSHGVPIEEYNALVALYNSTEGANWIDNTNWLSDAYVDDWYGITTSTGHVTELNLYENNLEGAIPSEIGNLVEITQLLLWINQISSIPSEIGNLTSLVDLTLFANQLTSIPSEIGNLTSLINLDLDINQISMVPSTIGNLNSLTHLWLQDNQLSELPDLSGLVNLSLLGISNNFLTFGDLENCGLNFGNLSDTYYSTQANLSTPLQTTNGENILLSFSTDGTGNTYQWKDKITQLEVTSATTSELNITTADSGIYYCEIKNDNFPNLTLSTGLLGVNSGIVSLSNNSIDENSPAGTVIGEFSVTQDTNFFSGSYISNIYYERIGSVIVDHENYEKYLQSIDENTCKTYMSIWTDAIMYITINEDNSVDVSVDPETWDDTLHTIDWGTSSYDPITGIIHLYYGYTRDTGIRKFEEIFTIAENQEDFSSSFAMGDGLNQGDNSSFNINGNILKTVIEVDYETQSEFQTFVKVDNSNPYMFSFVEGFKITVNNLNDNSPILNDYTFAIDENLINATLIGTITATDADGDLNPLTYSIVSGNTNDAFTIDNTNGEISVNQSVELDFETIESFELVCQVSDGTNTDIAVITINLNNLNEAPTNIELSNNTIDENQASGSVVGILTAIDQDDSDTYTFILISSSGSEDADNSSFTIDGNILKTNTILDYETQQDCNIYVQAVDAVGASYEQAFVIQVNDLTETGIEDVSESIAVFPNPSNGKFSIGFNSNDYNVKIYDAIGNLIFQEKSQNQNLNVDLEGIVSGVCFIVIKGKDSIAYKKIIIQ